MKRIILVCFLLCLSTTANAGFISGFFSSTAANALMSSDGEKLSIVDKEKLQAKKLQSILEMQGYYTYKIDGDLNSFDSRTAIKKYQDSKKTGFLGFFKDELTGVLNEEDKNNLLYLADLISKANQIEITKDIKSIDQALDRLELIKDEIESLEEKTSSRVISGKIDEILESFKNVMPKWKELLTNKNVFYSPKWKKLYYVNLEKKYNWNEDNKINSVCSKLNVAQLQWELSTRDEGDYYSFQEELHPVFVPNKHSKVYLATAKNGEIYTYWSKRYNKIKSFDWSRREKSNKKYRVLCQYKFNSYMLTK